MGHRASDGEASTTADAPFRDYLAEAQRKIDQSVQFDHDKYRIEWGGQFENQQRAQARLTLIMGLVLALMACCSLPQFGKMRQAMLILGAVPLATLGGLIALHFSGETLNVATPSASSPCSASRCRTASSWSPTSTGSRARE